MSYLSEAQVKGRIRNIAKDNNAVQGACRGRTGKIWLRSAADCGMIQEMENNGTSMRNTVELLR